MDNFAFSYEIKFDPANGSIQPEEDMHGTNCGISGNETEQEPEESQVKQQLRRAQQEGYCVTTEAALILLKVTELVRFNYQATIFYPEQPKFNANG